MTAAVRIGREQGATLDETLDVLLAAELHLAYANFAPMAGRVGAVVALHKGRWRAAAADPGVLVARDPHGRPLAMVRLADRVFESQHFGMRIASIEAPAGVAEEDLRLTALRALYGAACETLRAAGYAHVTAQAATQDRAASWALQEAGCFHVGTKISWMAPLTGQEEPGLPAPLRIEIHDRATIPTLPPASWRRLYEWTGTAFDRGPFVFDLSVPHDRARAVYQTWTRKALTGEWAEVLLVVRDGDEIVAFNAMQLLSDLSKAAGVGILGRGIGASLPGYRGSFTALQRACAAARPLGAAFLENETQASTLASIQVFGRLGHQCIRSVSSFHRRLDAAATAPR